uniref:WD repeat-containing protein 74 n=1 Tax=Panagrolaimus sp. PS1159 TaxID=55785 RepID=A0AC35GQF4_9BILA
MCDAYVGAATGAFKCVSFKDGKITNANTIADLIPKETEITAMCFGDIEQSEVIACQANHKIKLYNSITNLYSELFTVEGCEGKIIGLSMLSSDKIITAAKTGQLQIWTPEGKLLSSDEWNAGNDILAFDKKPSSSTIIATSGKENLLKIWDIETRQITWSARNVKHDKLNVRVPIWDNGLKFINENEIVTVTGTSHIRIYDPRTQRKPVHEYKFMDTPITALSLCNRQNHIIASNTTGDMGLFDLRGGVQLLYKFRGFAGAVRSIAAHPTEPFVVSVGIDRHIRLHNMDAKKLVKKLYAKVRMNCCLIKNQNECALVKIDK